MYIKNLRLDNLEIDELQTHPGESWCFYGENRSGIDDLVELFMETGRRLSADILELPDNRSILSFQAQQDIFEEELRNDDTDVLNRIDPGTLVREFLGDYDAHLLLLRTFGLDQCLDLGYRQLSSGQARKLILLKVLTDGTSTLIIQNPYDGLDEQTCLELNQVLSRLPEQDIQLILTVNSRNDIPVWCSHVGIIAAGRLEYFGLRENMVPLLYIGQETEADRQEIENVYSGRAVKGKENNKELVYLKDCTAAYGGKRIFAGLDLVIEIGDHTLVTGPNGCGKSTLLDIICGDNPQCYSNNLRIFGRQRGTGESIWDIKRNMGLISPALHREYRVPGSALHVVLSGLYDSIGLYKKVHESEVRTGLRWLDWVGLRCKADVSFRRLPFAEQQLVLIARALVKSPRLLVLDEPTHALDDSRRYALLDLLERIAKQRLSTILYVSHRKDEHRSFFRQRITLDSYSI